MCLEQQYWRYNCFEIVRSILVFESILNEFLLIHVRIKVSFPQYLFEQYLSIAHLKNFYFPTYLPAFVHVQEL